MPDMAIEIGGKTFTVACEEGQEAYLRSAAEMLDREAQALIAAGARLTTDRMLLMAGLMLADRAASADEELRTMDRRLAQQTKMIDELNARPEPEAERVEVEVEVPVVPAGAFEKLERLAEEAEAMVAKAG